MNDLGLVSISFRSLTPEQIICAVKEAGLTCIEWGSDVHAPCNDPAKLIEVARLMRAAGVKCCSYGTYFKLGVDPLEALLPYIQAAKLLGTNILRLWCGTKASLDYTPQERAELYAQCRAAAAMAEEHGVTLCMECHNWYITDRKESALELMQAVDSPAFRMYWQPNQFFTPEENLAYLRLLSPYITHIHVFNWTSEAWVGKDLLPPPGVMPEMYPLKEAVSLWQQYLQCVPNHHALLLEFMPDDRVESLPVEAAALKEIVGE